MSEITVALAQVNPLVGDIPGNTACAIEYIDRAREKDHADLVLFPELMLTGYPPEDLLLRPSLDGRIDAALAELAPHTRDIAVVVGYPRRREGVLMNMAGFFRDGKLVAEYAKQQLPNYQVFDEKRYFGHGDSACIVEIKGLRAAITICEDIWHPAPMMQASAAGADLMININASPFHRHKHQERLNVVTDRVLEGNMPVVYLNMVGGQDELVFDGGSMVITPDGKLAMQAPMFDEGLFITRLQKSGDGLNVADGPREEPMELLPSVYRALVVGIRDYIDKNGFRGVVIGLSGGIDSALTAAVAVDALGPDRVEVVMMPFRYTSEMSRSDAEEEARLLGVNYQSISIEPIYDVFIAQLADEFADLPVDKTEENLQARARGVLLMAISNKKGLLVVTTGNKSENAVGYCTLYGDMVGGFNVLKDVPKTLVYELARYRNTLSRVIPETVITRPPSAELAPDQKDEDSLPPYPVLDKILEMYIEDDLSAEAIIRAGYAAEDVYHVIRLVDINEYKRRQAAIGVRITRRGFGRDRRYPVTNGWKPGS